MSRLTLLDSVLINPVCLLEGIYWKRLYVDDTHHACVWIFTQVKFGFASTWVVVIWRGGKEVM